MRAIRLSSLALALLGGTALATAANPAGAADITVFGDSYSQVPRLKFPNWVTQLQQDEVVDDVDNFAKSGATAANVGTNTLLRQTKLWKNAGKPVNDYVVVFFGINDIRKFDDFAKSRSGYKSALQELEKAGANLVLVQVPDLGRVPEFAGTGQSAKLTSKTNTWNKFVKQRADEFDGQLVNLFNIFPGNSQAFDPNLFQDELHPNEEGQGLIAAAIGAKLGSSSKVARSLELSNKIAKTRTADAQSGLAFALATMPEGDEQLNLIAFPVGDGALTEAEGASDPGRSSFADVYGLDDRDGGAGVNYTLPDGTMLGIVISTYGDSQQDTVDFGASTSTVTSEQVASYIDKKLGAFSLGTRFGYSRDRHEIENFDDFSGSHDSAAFDGRTLELAQRIGLPQAHEGFTLTPWAELAYERADTDSFTIGNPYFDDQTYSADSVTDTLGSIGLDVRLDPFQLGETGWLTLFGGISYTHGIVQDDYQIRTEDSFGVEEDTIDRPDTRTFGLSVGASLALGERLALEGGLGLEHDLNTGTEETARLALSYRF